MFKKYLRNLAAVFMAFLCLLNSVPVIAAEKDSSIDEYTYELSDRNFEKKYIVKLSENATGNIITQELYVINDSGIITEEFITANLHEDYSLESIEVIDLDIQDESYDDSEIQPRIVDTVFDIGCLVISATEFYNNPSVWNGIEFVLDGAAVLFPCIPSLTGAARMIKSSDKLQDSLKYGIKTYREHKKVSSVSFPAHHIMPKKFAALFGYSENDMFSIIISKADHQKITSKLAMNKYGLNLNKELYTDKDYVIEQLVKVYDDLFEETGDELFEFMSKFISYNSQYGIN